MTWFAFQGLNGGKAIDLAGAQEKIATGEGFHGYGDELAAEAHPNAVNPLTRGLADLLIADYHSAVSTQSQPGGKNASNLGLAANPVLGGLDAIGAFFSKLADANLWIRVLKITLGGVLLIEGIMRMSGTGLTPSAILGAQASKPISAARKAVL